ncbi:acyl carrier protein [Streptomyces sp. NPDC051567]|uniref:acyl carrier protein n=1 Tax=Streptomyces sp. NPDC051567 TaxID=3365660 RepID=UPI0037B894E2
MYEKIGQLLTEKFGVDPRAVTPDATLRSLGLDSMSLVEMAVIMAEETGLLAEGLHMDVTLAEAAEHYRAAAGSAR